MVKVETKSYTTSQIAKDAGVSVAAISNLILKLKLKPVETGKHNRKYYSSKDRDTILKHYQNKVKVEAKSNNGTKDDVIAALKDRIEEQSEMIELLKGQLEVKDAQIERANKLADQAQQLDLTTHSQQQKQLQATEDVEVKTENEEKDFQDQREKKGFWSKLFNFK